MSESNNPGVGGRGKRAPYKTTHYRIPIALKPIVEEMAFKYRELVCEYEADDPALIEAVINTIRGEKTNKNIDPTFRTSISSIIKLHVKKTKNNNL